MAFYCDNCNYIFYKKRTSCPYCGMSLDMDQLPEEELLAQGYTVAPGEKKGGGKTNAQTLIEQMSNSFTGGAAVTPAPNPKPVKTQEKPRPAVSIPPVKPQPVQPVKPQGTDFFAALSANGAMQQLPVVQAPANPAQANEDIEVYNRTLRELAADQRRLRRQQRMAEIFHSFGNIPAGSILRILLFIGAILVLIGLWNARYVILDAFMSLIMSILPTLVILWLLWTIIRSFFR